MSAVLLPNATQRAGLEVKKDGTVLILGADNQMHIVHPAVVEAFALGKITPGVWAVAQQLRQAPAARILLPQGILSK